MDHVIAACNGLTRRWLGMLAPNESAVLSGAGVWPLLLILAKAGAAPVRQVIADIAGPDALPGPGATQAFLRTLRSTSAVSTACGIWHRHDAPIDPAWLQSVDADHRGALTGNPESDRETLDAWAAAQTGGLISRLPAVPDCSRLALTLITAVVVRTQWLEPFTDRDIGSPASGPWHDRGVPLVRRASEDLGGVRVLTGEDGSLTCVDLDGTDGMTVHLVLGPDHLAPAAVMSQACNLVRTQSGTSGADLRADAGAPGVTIVDRTAYSPKDLLILAVPEFTLTSEHDLLNSASVFGLDQLGSPGAHLPDISSEPMTVASASQNAYAALTASGFEAAAATTTSLAVEELQAPPTSHARHIEVTFDRPFGFLAVARGTGLIITAGWIASVSEPPGARRG